MRPPARIAAALRTGCALACFWACGAAPAAELAELINAYRSKPRPCDGRMLPPGPPLTPHPLLSDPAVAGAAQPLDALKAAGHPGRRVQVLEVVGAPDPETALAVLRQRQCAALLSPEPREIGVHREGHRWRIVLLQPLLSPQVGPPAEAGREILERVNAARAEPRRCGQRRLESAAPLRWSDALARAALEHSQDMARRNYFAHRGPDGRTVGERATRAGYRWRAIGENIAAGPGDTQSVVARWLASPGHCANVMNNVFTEMGAAYALSRQADMSIYWVQVFGAPRR